MYLHTWVLLFQITKSIEADLNNHEYKEVQCNYQNKKKYEGHIKAFQKVQNNTN